MEAKSLQQIEIVQLVPVAHDVALDLAGVHPGHEILHIPGDQERRIRDDFCPDSNVALFNERNCLYRQHPSSLKKKRE